MAELLIYSGNIEYLYIRLTLQTHFPVLSSGNGDVEPTASHIPEKLIIIKCDHGRIPTLNGNLIF